MRRVLGWLRDHDRELVALAAATFVQMFIRQTQERLHELEQAEARRVALGDGLKALEDVATLNDLQRQWDRTVELVSDGQAADEPPREA